MKKVLTAFLCLILFTFLTGLFAVSTVSAVTYSCDSNCGSGTNFCGCGTQPRVTCDNEGCTQNCITSCSTTIDCTIGDGTLKGDAYCGQFGASCPASTSDRQFFNTTVTCPLPQLFCM